MINRNAFYTAWIHYQYLVTYICVSIDWLSAAIYRNFSSMFLCCTFRYFFSFYSVLYYCCYYHFRISGRYQFHLSQESCYYCTFLLYHYWYHLHCLNLDQKWFMLMYGRMHNQRWFLYSKLFSQCSIALFSSAFHVPKVSWTVIYYY